MKKNEHGRQIYVSAKEDISLATYFELIVKSPIKDNPEFKILEQDGLEKAITDLIIDDVIVFEENTYVSYTTKRNDFPVDGEWKIRLYVEFGDGSQGFMGDWSSFVVEP